MPTVLRVYLVIAFLSAGLALPAAPAAQAAGSVCDPDGTQTSGAVYRLCMPTGPWNGDLVVYAHGYVAYNEPIAIPEDQLSIDGGPSVPEIVNGLGYAFATTSYRVNGLAVRQGSEDLLDLVDVFRATYGEPARVYLVGPSEGGVITALLLEQYPQVFDGALSACGPVGSFRGQINYWGDARVLFDYYFPGLLPGDATEVPQDVIDNWDSVYAPLLEAQLRGQPARRQAWMEVAHIPDNPLNLDQTVEGLMDLLWYNAFATNDGIVKLGGQPFDNSRRWYRGSDNDLLLNSLVPRYSADPAAVAEMESYYQTSGLLQKPIVMLHSADPLIPFWHEPLYTLAVNRQGSADLHTSLPALRRYGHCNFTVPQLLLAFVVLVRQVTGAMPADAGRVLTSEAQRQEFQTLLESLPALQQEGEQPGAALYLPLLPANIP